ncbi:succinate dehydrogenase, cytochrome b556 subunit [Iodidimonas muriae]|uniref:Succinate dehydrogenase cytochrome b556 subunit n=1 Tax=Iodidimonas muriae TaxID=261467 RepID=A0ABQ2LDP7_9PROT|nr:succinate dehydrogenase, cytochrome b556 subunit [Iodidimonas muriae]GER06906.1 succinate dehydrogenase, cytochrome b556 subunit [Kordiimonadales bacterium JCM 17843]GGO09521.1 succinate dehydrogenase, cytochrome b556 subunit [Iodidimonas muriae]
MASTHRPLSPHLQIWRWGLHMGLSISHRVTGSGNAVGALILVWGFCALATGPEAFAFFMDVMTSLLGRIVLFGVTLSVMLHLCTGVRHLIMDSGRGLDIETNRKLGYAAIIVAIVLTLGLWGGTYWFAGAL